LTFFFLAIVLSVLLWFTASDYRFDLFLFGHCIVCPLIYGFWLPFWPFSFWSLYCLSFDIRLLITVLTFIFLVIVLSVLWYTASDYRLDLFLFGHCIVCPLIYGFWLPLWYFFFNTIVLTVPRFMASDYLFSSFSLIPLFYLFLYFRLLITSFVLFLLP
jgi:hypothetical protein